MEGVVPTLASLASPIEMAFSANLLLTAWAAVYRAQVARESEQVQAAEDFRKDEILQEELSIRRHVKTIAIFKRGRKISWFAGLLFCILSAVGLYVAAWHFPELAVPHGWRWNALMAAVYTGPAFMLLMYIWIAVGNWWIGGQYRELSDQQKAKREAKERQDALTAIPRLANIWKQLLVPNSPNTP